MDSDQAERLSIDLAMAERQLVEAEHKEAEAIRRVEAYKRLLAGMEAELVGHRTREQEQTDLIRRLRFIIQQKTAIPPYTAIGRATGKPAIVCRAAESKYERLIGDVGTVLSVLYVGRRAHSLTLRFPDGAEHELLPTEVEADPLFVEAAMGEAAS